MVQACFMEGVSYSSVYILIADIQAMSPLIISWVL